MQRLSTLTTPVLVRNFNDARPIVDLNDSRLRENRMVLQWFQDWSRSKNIGTGENENDAAKRRELPPKACLEDITWLIIGFESLVKIMLKENIPVVPCERNSDIIENYFCSQRGIGGCKTNPTVKDFLINTNSIVLGTSLVSTKSNAGIKRKNADPYSYNNPVPVKRKPYNKSTKGK